MNTTSKRFIMCSLITMMLATLGSTKLHSATQSRNSENYTQKIGHRHTHSKSKNHSSLKVLKKETSSMKGVTFGWIPIPSSSREMVGEQPSYSYKVTRIKPNLVQVVLRFTKIAHYPKVFTSLQTRASDLQSYFCKDSNAPMINTVNVDASKKEVTLELTSDRTVHKRYFPFIGTYTFQDTYLHFIAFDEHESSRSVSALASHLQ